MPLSNGIFMKKLNQNFDRGCCNQKKSSIKVNFEKISEKNAEASGKRHLKTAPSIFRCVKPSERVCVREHVYRTSPFFSKRLSAFDSSTSTYIIHHNTYLILLCSIRSEFIDILTYIFIKKSILGFDLFGKRLIRVLYIVYMD